MNIIKLTDSELTVIKEALSVASVAMEDFDHRAELEYMTLLEIIKEQTND